MTQFNKTLLENFLIPLVKEVATAAKKEGNTGYLYKLLINEQLTSGEIKIFKNTYFYSKQAEKMPFSGHSDADENFQNHFLASLSTYFTLRNRLSGLDGAFKAYLPDEEGEFSAETQKNIYKLAFQISLDFEKKQLREMIARKYLLAKGEKELKDYQQALAMVESGQLLLIEVNGQQVYISAEEIKHYSEDPRFQNVEVTPLFAPSAEVAQFSEQKAYHFDELEPTFQTSQELSCEKLLEQNGLEVTKSFSKDASGQISGEVKDVSGQTLKVRIKKSRPGCRKHF